MKTQRSDQRGVVNLLAVSGACAVLLFAESSWGAEKPELQPPPASTTPSAKEPAPAKPAASSLAPGEISLFDGKTLKGWRVSDFAGKGEVTVQEGRIVIGMGVMSGITYTSEIPRMNYEVTLEAMRVDGSDFFCALTFPVDKDPCTLVVGGWGGGVVGLSCLDGGDAANNETTQFMNFENKRWYKVRLRVVPSKIQAWIDETKLVDVTTTDRKVSIRWEVEPSLPFGIATWATSGAVRNIRIRRL